MHILYVNYAAENMFTFKSSFKYYHWGAYVSTTSCMILDIAPLPRMYALTAFLSLQVCFLGGCCDEDI